MSRRIARPATSKAWAARPAAALVVWGLAGAGLAGGLSGCAQLDEAIQPPAVNPSSPIAPYAEQVSRERFATPTFAEVPPKPADLRPVEAYKTAVVRQIDFRRQLAAWRTSHPDLTSDTEAWADLQRHRIPQGSATPVSVEHDAEAEAFARRLREEAGKTPPSQ